MFDSLNKGLANAFNKLKGGNVLTENNIKEAIKIVKRSLIEADVELDTVKSLINEIKTEAIGQKIYKNIKAQEAFIKIVNDHIVEILGNENQEIDLDKNNISYIMMVGLQGAGKTTTSAKLAKLLQKEKNKKVLLASLDIYRPAARKQLEVLANDNNIESFPIDEDNKNIKSLVKEIKAYAKEKECKIVILDTAGRLHIDNELMEELSLIKDLTKPTK